MGSGAAGAILLPCVAGGMFVGIGGTGGKPYSGVLIAVVGVGGTVACAAGPKAAPSGVTGTCGLIEDAVCCASAVFSGGGKPIPADGGGRVDGGDTVRATCLTSLQAAWTGLR